MPNNKTNSAHMISKSRVTVKDVAAEAGCSVMTVSNVVNKVMSVRPEIRERVTEVIERLGYKPNSWARQLGRSRARSYPAPATRQFGCLLSTPLGKYGDPYFGEMIEALEDELRSRNFELSFVETWDESVSEEKLRDLVAPQNIDVLVLLNCEQALSQVRSVAKSIIVVGSFWTDRTLDYVCSDMMDGGWKATNHLLSLGHRKIAYIGPRAAMECGATSREREAGYILAMQAHADRPPIRLFPTESASLSEGFDAGMELLQSQDRPTAIFAHSDFMAAGVLKAAAQLNISVPQELSVVGFNDDQLAVMTHPELTTIRVDKRGIGILAAQTGVDRISNPKLPGRMILLPVELVVRGSAARL